MLDAFRLFRPRGGFDGAETKCDVPQRPNIIYQYLKVTLTVPSFSIL
jgi:hypothetical protein